MDIGRVSLSLADKMLRITSGQPVCFRVLKGKYRTRWFSTCLPAKAAGKGNCVNQLSVLVATDLVWQVAYDFFIADLSLILL
ncbi:hypothetical protein CSQ88_17185 [Iodobacter sp. BJB302]|nr:hypothetical protein CSQ88_17185 [Iodobacter sp. BJB302]